MIYGIGTDIVRVARMQDDLARFGEKFAERILTDRELEEYRRCAERAHFLARRFAAKEAAAKALGTGFREGLSLRNIGVAHDAKGKPLLEFSGRALEIIREQGITEIHVSLADEADHAVAFVTFETPG
jgi:holo-[acyl-carrier protein] synthase